MPQLKTQFNTQLKTQFNTQFKTQFKTQRSSLGSPVLAELFVHPWLFPG